MFIVIRKHNVLLVLLVLLLAVSVFCLNLPDGDATPVSNITYNPVTVIVDAGHGGEDPGAESDYSGILEKDLNLDIALKLKGLLEEQGVNVLMTRDSDILVYPEGTPGYTKKRKADLIKRRQFMDESDADLIVSIHLNKFPQTKYYGAQTFYPAGSNDSKKLANLIQTQLKEQVDETNERKSQATKDKLIILKDQEKVITIVECGFLSNEQEEKKLQESEYREKLANAIKNGIINYVND